MRVRAVTLECTSIMQDYIYSIDLQKTSKTKALSSREVRFTSAFLSPNKQVDKKEARAREASETRNEMTYILHPTINTWLSACSSLFTIAPFNAQLGVIQRSEFTHAKIPSVKPCISLWSVSLNASNVHATTKNPEPQTTPPKAFDFNASDQMNEVQMFFGKFNFSCVLEQLCENSVSLTSGWKALNAWNVLKCDS